MKRHTVIKWLALLLVGLNFRLGECRLTLVCKANLNLEFHDIINKTVHHAALITVTKVLST